MTTYDGVMIGLVLAGVIWGAWRGLTWIAASLVSLVAGYAVALPASGALAPHLPGEPAAARMLAMLVAYVATSGGIFAIAWMIRRVLRALDFSAFDRHLGMVLGALLGAGVGVIGTLFVTSLAPDTREPIFGSRSGHAVAWVMANVGPALPAEARELLSPSWPGALGGAEAAVVRARDAAKREADRGGDTRPRRGRADLQDEPARQAERDRGRRTSRRDDATADDQVRTAATRAVDAVGQDDGLRDLVNEGRRELGRRAAGWIGGEEAGDARRDRR